MGVGDDQLELAFQDGMDRLPVNPGALHADMRDTQLLEPVPHRLQVPGQGREGSDLLARLASPISTQAVAWSRPAQRSMIASIISSVKLLPWRSPHRKSMTEARAGPDRVATLGDAWMRCRSIS